MTGTVVAYGLSFGLKILAKPPTAPAPAGEPAKPPPALAPVGEPAKLRSCLKKPAKKPEPEPEPEPESQPAPAEPTFLDFVIIFLTKTPEQTVAVPEQTVPVPEPAIPLPEPAAKSVKIKVTPTRVQMVSRWIIKREHCHNRSSEKRQWVYDEDDEDIIMHNG